MSKKLKPLIKLPEKMGKVADVVNNIIDHIKNGSGGGGKDYSFIPPLKENEQGQVYIEGDVGKVYTGVRPIVVNNETNTISYDEHPTPPPAGSLHGSYVIKQGTNISEPSLLIEAGDGGFGKDDPYGETSIFSWLKLNSHAYVGKWNYETNKLDLWQLKDDDFTKFADGSDATDYITDDVEQGYNVFMKLPKFWYKDTVDIEDNVHFYAANYEIEGYNEWDDTQLFGVYEAYVDTNVADADRVVRSISEVNSTGNITHTKYKEYSRNDNDGKVIANDKGFSLITFEQHNIMAWLFYGYYGSTHAQHILGYGTTAGNTTDINKITGLRDTDGMNDSTVGGNTTSIKFWGLENWWGNKSEWIDNLVMDTDNQTCKILDLAGNFKDSYKFTAGKQACISKIHGKGKGYLFPEATSGTDYDKYFADYFNYGNSGCVARRSSIAGYPGGGVAYLVVDSVPFGSDADRASRLAYCGEINIVE